MACDLWLGLRPSSSLKSSPSSVLCVVIHMHGTAHINQLLPSWMRQSGSRALLPRAVGPWASHASWKKKGWIPGSRRALPASKYHNHNCPSCEPSSPPRQQGGTRYYRNATGRSRAFGQRRFKPLSNKYMVLFRCLYCTLCIYYPTGYTPHVVCYHILRCDTHFGVYSTICVYNHTLGEYTHLEFYTL